MKNPTGNTPLVELKNIEQQFDLKAKIFAKVEAFNPAGSIKDRIAWQMICDAEEEGRAKEGTVFGIILNTPAIPFFCMKILARNLAQSGIS